MNHVNHHQVLVNYWNNLHYRLLLQRMDPREGNNIKVKDVTKYYPIAHASAKRIERLFTVLNDHKK